MAASVVTRCSLFSRSLKPNLGNFLTHFKTPVTTASVRKYHVINDDLFGFSDEHKQVPK